MCHYFQPPKITCIKVLNNKICESKLYDFDVFARFFVSQIVITRSIFETPEDLCIIMLRVDSATFSLW